MRFAGLLFDFDGVLIESEYAGNRQVAEWLTEAGYPTTPEDSMAHFMGLAGADFRAAIERWIGGPLPESFQAAREAEDARAMAAGIDAVAGAVAFVRSLPADLPRAVVSSSPTRWIRRHLDHIGLADAFVHISAVERAGMATLNEGDKLEFELEVDRRGKYAAVNLSAAS